MNLDNPALLMSGMVIGTVGFGFFIYGKKAVDTRFLVSGIALSVIPFFAHTMLVMWGLSGLCGAALYLTNRA
jgi:hypothetical protein